MGSRIPQLHLYRTCTYKYTKDGQTKKLHDIVCVCVCVRKCSVFTCLQLSSNQSFITGCKMSVGDRRGRLAVCKSSRTIPWFSCYLFSDAELTNDRICYN